MRLIDADVLLCQIKATSKDSGFYRPLYDGFEETVNRCPTIEAEPVRHGYWIFKGKSNGRSIYQCSECKNDISGSAAYCKECGAKMDAQPPEETEDKQTNDFISNRFNTVI